MKAALEPGTQTEPVFTASTDTAKEWNWRNLLKVGVATLLLFAVYLAASWLPVEPGATSMNFLGGFLLFWILGGVFTITLLAVSDRNS